MINAAWNIYAAAHGVTWQEIDDEAAGMPEVLALVAAFWASARSREAERIANELTVELLAVPSQYFGTTEAALGYIEGLERALDCSRRGGSVEGEKPE